MNVAVMGRGLIGGSIEKAAIRAGHRVEIFRGRGPVPDLAGFDFVFVATPPKSVAPIIDAIAAGGTLKDGAIVADIAGVKAPIVSALSKYATETRWHFVGAHPMAGKERTGYANSCADLFDGASMILTPFDQTPEAVVGRLDAFCRELGFARVVVTDVKRHDEMIAFTSQLCHLVSSAYVRDPLAKSHAGFSAGSFRDMVRVGAPDPDVWTDLFFMNAEPLSEALSRFAGRIAVFADALKRGDAALMHRELEAGVEAKRLVDEATAAAKEAAT